MTIIYYNYHIQHNQQHVPQSERCDSCFRGKWNLYFVSNTVISWVLRF